MPQDLVKNDIQADWRSRLIEQYRDSTKLHAVLDLFATEFEEARDAIWDLRAAFDLDTAVSWRLDILGKAVGLPRPTVNAGLFEFFGYAGAAGAASYGDLNDPGIGGRYLSVFGDVAGNVPMEDEDYRLHIRAKVVRNMSGANPETFLKILRLVIPNPVSLSVTRSGQANILVVIGRNLSTIEKGLFLVEDLNGNGDKLLPRAAGVSIDYEDAAGPFP